MTPFDVVIEYEQWLAKHSHPGCPRPPGVAPRRDKLEMMIRAYGRQERAKGLRAAARQARRDAATSAQYADPDNGLDARAYGEREIAQWADRRARQVEKGE